MRCITSFICKQLVLVSSLSLDISKSSISLDMFVHCLQKNVLYVSKLVFVSIISRSIILLFIPKNLLNVFNEMVNSKPTYSFNNSNNGQKLWISDKIFNLFFICWKLICSLITFFCHLFIDQFYYLTLMCQVVT